MSKGGITSTYEGIEDQFLVRTYLLSISENEHGGFATDQSYAQDSAHLKAWKRRILKRNNLRISNHGTFVCEYVWHSH